jgi:hypothetical protein
MLTKFERAALEQEREELRALKLERQRRQQKKLLCKAERKRLDAEFAARGAAQRPWLTAIREVKP